jgi:hypothetical protein
VRGGAHLLEARLVARVRQHGRIAIEHRHAHRRRGVDVGRRSAPRDHQGGVVVGALDALVLGGERLPRMRDVLALVARRMDGGARHDTRLVCARTVDVVDVDRRRALNWTADVVEQDIEQPRAGLVGSRRDAPDEWQRGC